jgi:Fic family protein
LGTKFETVDWRNVAAELIKLQKPVEELVEKFGEFSTREYLLQCLKIHHRITQIHPFREGNGRTTIAFMNVQLVRAGLTPIYIKFEEKKNYIAALEKADTEKIMMIYMKLYLR